MNILHMPIIFLLTTEPNNVCARLLEPPLFGVLLNNSIIVVSKDRNAPLADEPTASFLDSFHPVSFVDVTVERLFPTRVSERLLSLNRLKNFQAAMMTVFLSFFEKFAAFVADQ